MPPIEYPLKCIFCGGKLIVIEDEDGKLSIRAEAPPVEPEPPDEGVVDDRAKRRKKGFRTLFDALAGEGDESGTTGD